MSDEEQSAFEAYQAKVAEFEKARREVERVRQDAISELLRHRKAINAELRRLGYLDGDQADTAGASQSPRTHGGDKTCPYCEIAGHDGRAHRGQDVKRAFTRAELRERGFLVEEAAPPVELPGSIEALLEPAAETQVTNGGPRRRRLKEKPDETRHCPVCEVDGHDLRAHRGQARKRPFSKNELRERGLA